MTKRRPSLMEFMQEQNLLNAHLQLPQEALRKEFESSALVRDMEQTARKINKAAGSLLIDVQSYLWPEPLIRTFTFHKKREVYVMQLEIWNNQLALTFLFHRAPGTILSRYLPWLFAHWLGLHEVEVIVKSSWTLKREAVAPAQIEGWFVYLLSGFDSAHAPAVGTARADRNSTEIPGLSIPNLSRPKTFVMDEVS